MKKNQLINLCQSDSRMKWMNLLPDEKLDLEIFVNGYCNLFHVGKQKALFVVLAWVLSGE